MAKTEQSQEASQDLTLTPLPLPLPLPPPPQSPEQDHAQKPEPKPEAPVQAKAIATQVRRRVKLTSRLRPRGISKTIYFPDARQIETLENHLKAFPRSGLSSVLSRLIPPLNDALSSRAKNSRTVTLTTDLFL